MLRLGLLDRCCENVTQRNQTVTSACRSSFRQRPAAHSGLTPDISRRSRNGLDGRVGSPTRALHR